MTTRRDAAVPSGHRDVLVVFSGLLAGMLLSAIDGTMVATALPTIASEMGGLDDIGWIVTSYLLAATVTTPIFGKASDLIGRRELFRASIVVFLVGSVSAGLSQSMAHLVAARILQGIGGGGLLSLSRTIVADIIPPRRRGEYQGYITAVHAVSSILGPVVGGLVVDNIGWRWVFFVNMPIGVLAIVLASRLADDAKRLRNLKSLDFVGSILMVATIASLSLALEWSTSTLAWRSNVALILVAGAVLLGGLYLLNERRTDEPVIPLRLFSSKVFRLSGAATFLIGVAMIGTVVLLPMFLQIATGETATGAGMMLVPLVLSILVSSVVGGRVISRTGRYKLLATMGAAWASIAFVLLALVGPATPRAVVVGHVAAIGIGLGVMLPILTLTVQNDAEHRDMGVVTSTAIFLRALGGSLGSALFLSVASSRFAVEIGRAGGVDGVDLRLIIEAPTRVHSLSGKTREVVATAFSEAGAFVFLMAAVLAGACVVLLGRLPNAPLREEVGE